MAKSHGLVNAICVLYPPPLPLYPYFSSQRSANPKPYQVEPESDSACDCSESEEEPVVQKKAVVKKPAATKAPPKRKPAAEASAVSRLQVSAVQNAESPIPVPQVKTPPPPGTHEHAIPTPPR